MIGFTTVETHEHARKLAEGLIREKLAACVQMDASITSWFSWQNELTSEQEIRLLVKFPARNTEAIEAWLNEHHPYDTPQWLAIRAEFVGKEYGAWLNKVTR